MTSIVTTTFKFIQASINTGQHSIGRSRYFLLQTGSRVAISTAPRAASDRDRQTIVGLDPYHVDDVITSIKEIELVLNNLQSTQERQRHLFHGESDRLIPSRNSRMIILFEEAGLQQSIILKCLNNIKVNLIDAEKPLVSRWEWEKGKQR